MSVFLEEEGHYHCYLLHHGTSFPRLDPMFAGLNSFQEKHP
jgi:hypothetical protein